MAKYAVLNAFYRSRIWIDFRIQLIAERAQANDGKVLCEHCRKIIARPKDIIAHHKIELTPENVHDYNISLNPINIEIVCFDCHNKEHRRFGYNSKSNKNVYLVYGPPMSGKTTFVREHIKRGDIVIDMDRLYSAVTMLPAYDKPDNLFINVVGIHNQLIDNVKVRHGKWNDAWIVGGYADKYKRNRVANDLGAELIFCDASKEECVQRLESDPDRMYRKDEWIKYINKWFEQYTE